MKAIIVEMSVEIIFLIQGFCEVDFNLAAIMTASIAVKYIAFS
jgi:hypothetical protein